MIAFNRGHLSSERFSRSLWITTLAGKMIDWLVQFNRPINCMLCKLKKVIKNASNHEMDGWKASHWFINPTLILQLIVSRRSKFFQCRIFGNLKDYSKIMTRQEMNGYFSLVINFLCKCNPDARYLSVKGKLERNEKSNFSS